MKKILSIFPMIFEAQSVFKRYGANAPKVGDKVNLIKSDRISLIGLVSGFGCKAAKERIKNAISEENPDIVILSGYCGACRSGLNNGDMMTDGRYESESLNKIISEFGFSREKLATVKSLADDKKKRELMKAGYDAVEMEAELVIEAITECGSDAEFVHLRWVSDSANCKVPLEFFESMLNYDTGEIKMSIWNLIRSSLRRPRLILELKEFGKDLAPAQEKYNKDIVKFYAKIEKSL